MKAAGDVDRGGYRVDQWCGVGVAWSPPPIRVLAIKSPRVVRQAIGVGEVRAPRSCSTYTSRSGLLSRVFVAVGGVLFPI